MEVRRDLNEGETVFTNNQIIDTNHVINNYNSGGIINEHARSHFGNVYYEDRFRAQLKALDGNVFNSTDG
jgi:hypothetical protein